MNKYITAILAGLAALLAWLLRGKLADRKEQQLTTQRDEALVKCAQQQINAQAASKQAALQQQQQHNEDKIHAADSNSISTGLDNMFNK